ncbi:histidinol-phosphatase [Shimia marina]|uniref:Histidinol-phosphatase n=1 Tax=Shimia marina TaxID=321267 RepID=A0A0P1EPI9_9RHOB|nr:histidinol-phosphatase [Shimia marina]CUH52241.1 Histidinol-phosphatase [Shimia marina]SFE06581.1 histidinol-phosphatase, inositol monophosphatase family [Shimia marina]
MTYDRDALVAVADAMADAARSAILPHFRNRGLTADNKLTGGFDPVTVADRAAEQAMRAVLQEQRPQDAILGEEFGNQPGTSGLIWVLDPIDGTRGFITGTPTWGVLIAVSDDNGPIYGVVDQPYIGERFRGGLGVAEAQGPMGTTAFHTRQTAQLSEATLFSTFPEVGTEAERQAFERVSKNVKLTRYGMDCYAYALVAVGQVDLVIEAGLNAYDIQAPIAVIEAAGGLVTNWQGAPVHMGGQVVAAANAELHQQALELLNAG